MKTLITKITKEITRLKTRLTPFHFQEERQRQANAVIKSFKQRSKFLKQEI